MSLNDNVLDDIYTGDTSLLDDNETSMKTVTGNINTIIKNSQNPSQDPLLNRVITADVNLTTLSDSYDTLCEKKGVQEDIVTLESISRNEAILINEVFGNLLNSSLSLEQFTPFNSKTNYSYALRYMDKTISTEQESFINTYKVFLSETLKDVSSVLEKLLEDYYPNLTDNVNNLKYLNSNIYNKITSNKDLVVPYNDGFSNITNISLLELDPDLIKLTLDNKDSFKKTIILFRQLITIKEINCFIDILTNGDIQILYKDNSGIQEKSLTILDLAKIIQESNTELIVNSLVKEIEKTISDIDKLKTTNIESTDDFETIKVKFIDNKILANELICKANRLTNLTINLFSLVDTITDLFDYTKQF